MVENLFFKYSKKYKTLRNLVNEGELVEKLVLEGYVEVFTEKLSTIEKYCIFPMLHMWGERFVVEYRMYYFYQKQLN